MQKRLPIKLYVLMFAVLIAAILGAYFAFLRDVRRQKLLTVEAAAKVTKTNVRHSVDPETGMQRIEDTVVTFEYEIDRRSMNVQLVWARSPQLRSLRGATPRFVTTLRILKRSAMPNFFRGVMCAVQIKTGIFRRIDDRIRVLNGPDFVGTGSGSDRVLRNAIKNPVATAPGSDLTPDNYL